MIEKELEKIKVRNESIRRAILVSQMLETEGGKIFLEDMNTVTDDARRPDILSIVDMETLHRSHGFIQAMEQMKAYIERQKGLSMKPMVDEKTGEVEVLNESK